MSPSLQTYQHRQVVQHGPSIKTLEILDQLFLLRLICESPCRVSETRQPERTEQHPQKKRRPLLWEEKGERVLPHSEGENITPQMWLLQPLILDEVVVFPHRCQVFNIKSPSAKIQVEKLKFTSKFSFLLSHQPLKAGTPWQRVFLTRCLMSTWSPSSSSSSSNQEGRFWNMNRNSEDPWTLFSSFLVPLSWASIFWFWETGKPRNAPAQLIQNLLFTHWEVWIKLWWEPLHVH